MESNENIKSEAQDYIKNNCRYYNNYFYNGAPDCIIEDTAKILDRKILNINTFCFYLKNSCSAILWSGAYRRNLQRRKCRNLEFYYKALIKISMHIYYIFAEIDNIKAYIQRNKV